MIFLLAVGRWYALKRPRYPRVPFYCSIGLFLLSYAGLVISIWPYLVPCALSFEQAALPTSSQWFLLVGFIVVIPFILGYTVMGYRIFSGKLRPGEVITD